MHKRYRKVYSLPENLYTPGSPVLIAAGALHRDNQTGKILAQLKFRNLTQKNIIAAKVSLSAYDVFGKALEGVSEYQYLDLDATRNSEFGDTEAMPVPDPVTRVFEPRCTAVVFADGSMWTSPAETEWVTLPNQPGIFNQLGDLAAQYQRDTSVLSKFLPLDFYDLWFCSCGAINHEDESHCHSCHQEKANLFASLNMDGLRQRNGDYENEKAEQATRKLAAIKARQTKLLKILKPAAIIAAIAGVIFAGTLLVANIDSPFFKYSRANALMKSGEYQEAIAAFEALDGYKDSEENITECYYQEALRSINAGHIKEAYTLFCNLGDYKDSAEQAASLRNQYPIILVMPGEYVVFGTYEQDNNASNGSEDVEWLVLDVSDGKALLVSKYALESKPFHDKNGSTTWESSSLRSWLNDKFISSAFTADEKARICITDVPGDGSSADTTTQDKLFLLSYKEVQTYLPPGTSRTCEATDYAVAQGAINKGDLNSCRWLLRSNGRSMLHVSVVTGHNIKRNEFLVTDTGLGVRPAMWVDLS